MNFTDRLYVEIVPLEGDHPPVPHPVHHGHFDPAYVYKVLGVYNPSETSECYLMLANLNREIWFIPQRHTRAFRLVSSDEFFLPKSSEDSNGKTHRRHRAASGHRSPAP
jgi:hypothetical protein